MAQVHDGAARRIVDALNAQESPYRIGATMTDDHMKQAMLQIKVLDPHASIHLSEHTGRWYVEAKIGVSDGCVVSSGTKHAESPEEAVMSYMDMLRSVGIDRVIVTHQADGRQHWRWNGSAFALDHYWKPST